MNERWIVVIGVGGGVVLGLGVELFARWLNGRFPFEKDGRDRG